MYSCHGDARYGSATSQGVFRGLGDTKSPLWATLICNGVNVLLDALFIMYFGWGVRGAAWATIIGQVSACFPAHHHQPLTSLHIHPVLCSLLVA